MTAAFFKIALLCWITGGLALLTAGMMSNRSVPSSAGWYHDAGCRLIKMGVAAGVAAALLVALP